MHLNLTDEQRMLRDSLARLLQNESSLDRVRAAEAFGFDRKLWSQLCATGINMMRVSEAQGGGGMGLFEAVLVAEEAGRYLVSVPLAEAIPALGLLSVLDGAVCSEMLERASSGDIVVLAPAEVRPDEAQAVPFTAGGVVLGLEGDQVIAYRGIAAPPQANLGSGAIAHLVLSGKDAAGNREIIASGSAARAAFLAAVEEWKLLKAAMLVGLARRSLEMAAAYATDRQQFGKPIGAFQGIAHPLADALTEVDGARLLVWHAVWAIARGRPEAAATISMAWWWSIQSSGNAVARALHTFGGYGVSREYDIQLYYRRGKAWALLAGDPQKELLLIADRLWGATREVAVPRAGEVVVEFGSGTGAQAFGREVRSFFEANLNDELKRHAHHSVAGYHREFQQKLAQAGLLFPHWPEEYGGRGKTPFDMAEMAEVFEEFNWQRVTGPVTNQVAQIVMSFATDEVRKETLPRFASGDAVACLGFTEPSSGSDVFAAKTRAERRGDDWIINGQKIFTTAANVADYVFLLARTGPDVPKHAGLTLFLVPMGLPGVEVQPVHTMQDERTNITYFSDVRVPDLYRIGEVNGGVSVMAASLELEHGGDQYRISFSHMLKQAIAWARATVRNGRPLLQDEDTRRRLARIAVHEMVAKDLCYRAIWATEQRIPGRAAFGPMSKLFSTESYRTASADLMDLAAPDSLFNQKPGVGLIELGYRQSIGMTIYGGTSEVHRSLIAEQGLGMPRSRA